MGINRTINSKHIERAANALLVAVTSLNDAGEQYLAQCISTNEAAIRKLYYDSLKPGYTPQAWMKDNTVFVSNQTIKPKGVKL